MERAQRAVLLFLPGKLQLPGLESIADDRFNRLAWSAPNTTHPKGLIAAGMETGEVHVYDPQKIMAGKRYVLSLSRADESADESRIYTSHKHTGPVRGLDFNPIQKNLLASGAVNAEVSHSLYHNTELIPDLHLRPKQPYQRTRHSRTGIQQTRRDHILTMESHRLAYSCCILFIRIYVRMGLEGW